MYEAKVEELQTSRGVDSADVEGSAVISQVPDARMTLILDLSSKVTEQETEIMRLRDQLRSLSGEAGGTSTGHSEVSAESIPQSSDTGCRQPVHSPAHLNGSTDAAGSHGVLELSSKRLDSGGLGIPPTGKVSDVRNNFSLSRTSQGSIEGYFKNYSKPEKNGASFRAHWASSCFDDLTNDDDAGDELKTGVSADQDCDRVNSDVTTAGPLNSCKGSVPRSRQRRQNTRANADHLDTRTS